MLTFKKGILLLLIFISIAGSNYGQWTQSNGPYACDITRIKHLNSELFALFIKDLSQGIYRSSDNGDTWSYFRGFSAMNGGDITAIGTMLFVSDGFDVYRSADSGATWNDVSLTLPNVNFKYLDTVDSMLFAMAYGQMHMSNNNGTSWVSVSSGLPANHYPTSIVSIGSSWFLATTGGAYKSVNNGSSWTAMSIPLFSNLQSIVTNGTNLFACSRNGGGVYYSDDQGLTWTQFNNGLTNTSVNSLILKDSTLFAATATGVFASADTGASWSLINSGIEYSNVLSVCTNGVDVFAGTGTKGLFKSANNGTSWTHSSQGLALAEVFCLGEHNGVLYSGIAPGGIFYSMNNGNSWQPLNQNVSQFSVFSFLSYGNRFFAGTNNDVFISTDNGVTWGAIGLNDGIQDFYMKNDTIYAAGGDGLHISADSGATWQLKNNGLGGDLSSVTVAESAIFVSKDGAGGGIYRSTDQGNNWVQVNSGLLSVNDVVSAGDTIYSASSNTGGLFVSTDLGVTWNNLIPNENVLSVYLHGGVIFTGVAGKGVYISHDFGNTWFVSNPPVYNIVPFDWLENGSELFVATYAGVRKNQSILCSSFNAMYATGCNFYTSPSGNHTWDSTGVYVDTLVNAAGCDSLIAINLTVTYINALISYSGPASFCRGDSLLLNTSAAYDSWQWYRNNIPIVMGGSGPGYYAKTKGFYYCIVSDSLGCSDTTNTVYINVPCIPLEPNHEKTTGADGDAMQLEIIQEVPGGKFILNVTPGLLSVYNLTGQRVFQENIGTKQADIDLSSLQGWHIFTLYAGSGHIAKKVYIKGE